MGNFFSSPKKRRTKKHQIKVLPDTSSADLGEFLNQHSVIRMALHGGGGFGHQAAGITLMSRLRELGYKGRFHILVPYYSKFDDLIGRNIDQLIPGYDSSNRNTQSVGLCTIDRYDTAHEILDLSPVGLTIASARMILI